MNLEQYVTDVCAKLRGGEVVTIGVDAMPYRHLMASVLETRLTGMCSPVIEGLLNQVVSSQNNVNYLMEDCRNLKADLAELEKEREAAKPNRTKGK